MFQPLVMSPVFEKVNAPAHFALRQQERILGTLCHGLLAQRKAFKDTLSKLVDSCPAAKEAVKECFSEESSFGVNQRPCFNSSAGRDQSF
ncbi:hypothetical protein M8J76_008790 [Diaphorina citri]|jgi:hypothetical protein|nr:hypothetical protein M8J76_008790 [Diaphorina citri]